MSGFAAFDAVTQAPADKILGLREEYIRDAKTDKIDLSIGVYRGDDGRTRFLDVVHEMKTNLISVPVTEREDPSAKVDYLPITGLASYCESSQRLFFGADSAAVNQKRIITIQTIGGTGALRVGADFLKRYYPNSSVYVSDPTWVNHIRIFERAGFEVNTYPYFDNVTRTVTFEKMQQTLASAPAHSIVMLQANCHNPTGFDPSEAQWTEVLALCQKGQLIPFFDFAYLGFDQGLEEDTKVLRMFTEAGMSFLAAGSFSKNFSLYNSRIGTLNVVTQSADEASRVVSQIKTDIRATYSSPPRDPAKLVATILNNPELRARWEDEVKKMRTRISEMRLSLLSQLETLGKGEQFSHLRNQKGLFFYSGLSKVQMERLKREFGIYGIDDGRLCIAAITPSTLQRVAEAMAKV